MHIVCVVAFAAAFGQVLAQPDCTTSKVDAPTISSCGCYDSPVQHLPTASSDATPDDAISSQDTTLTTSITPKPSSSSDTPPDDAISSQDTTLTTSITPKPSSSSDTSPDDAISSQYTASSVKPASPSPPPDKPSTSLPNPPVGYVRVVTWVQGVTKTFQVNDIKVQGSNAEFQKLNGYIASRCELSYPDDRDPVQCNLELSNESGYAGYPAVPVFNKRFPLSFNPHRKVTGIKCYKI